MPSARSRTLPARPRPALLWLLACVALVAAGCTQTVRIPVRMPAQFNLPSSAHSIGVASFHPDGGNVISHILGPMLADRVAGMVADQGHYTVVARAELDQLLSGIGITPADLLRDDSGTPPSWNAFRSADVLVIGTYRAFCDEKVWMEAVTRRDSHGHSYPTMEQRAKRTVRVQADVQLVDVPRSTIIGRKPVGGSAWRSWSGGSAVWQMESTPLDELIERAAGRAAAQIMVAITPHTNFETRPYLKGAGRFNSLFDHAWELMRRGLWNDARSVFEQVIEQASAGNDNDAHKSRAAATYDLAILDEIDGDVWSAARRYQEAAHNLPGESKALDALARINRRVAEVERLQQQTGDGEAEADPDDPGGSPAVPGDDDGDGSH